MKPSGTITTVFLTAVAVSSLIAVYIIKHEGRVEKDPYKDQINTLIQLADNNDKKIRSLDSINRLEHQKIQKLEKSLTDLRSQTDKNLERYEKELNRLSNLTDSQLVLRFTDIFDYE